MIAGTGWARATRPNVDVDTGTMSRGRSSRVARRMWDPSLMSKQWSSNDESSTRFEAPHPRILVSVQLKRRSSVMVSDRPFVVTHSPQAAHRPASSIPAQTLLPPSNASRSASRHWRFLAEGMAEDSPDRILVLPWTPPSPYRRREIIPEEGGRSAAEGVARSVTSPRKAVIRPFTTVAAPYRKDWLFVRKEALVSWETARRARVTQPPRRH